MTTIEICWNLLFAAISAVFGVVVAVLYSNHELAKLKVSEKKELRRKLIKAFRFNIERLDQMEKQLVTPPRPEIPDYRLDTESVAHILFNGRDLFDGESWFDRFNWQRFQLVHINAKVDFLNDIINLSGIAWNAELSRARYSSLVGHLKVSKKEISNLIQEFEKTGRQ
jgi:hypothetical protein